VPRPGRSRATHIPTIPGLAPPPPHPLRRNPFTDDIVRGQPAPAPAAAALRPDNPTALLEGCDTNDRRRRRWRFAPPFPPSRRSVDFVADEALPLPPRPSSPSPDDRHDVVPPTPPTSAPDDKSASPIPSTSPRHLRRRLLFSPRPPPSRLLVFALDPYDDDDNVVSVALTATTTAAHGLSPP
jgi:hypothetical protein